MGVTSPLYTHLKKSGILDVHLMEFYLHKSYLSSAGSLGTLKWFGPNLRRVSGTWMWLLEHNIGNRKRSNAHWSILFLSTDLFQTKQRQSFSSSLQTFRPIILFVRILKQLTFHDFLSSHITDSCLRSLVWFQCQNEKTGLLWNKSNKSLKSSGQFQTNLKPCIDFHKTDASCGKMM